MTVNRTIRIRNVCVNNLQGIDLDIRHGQWLAICGLSGSGKSSLAFDTLYAEGQRRYIDCLSAGARTFVAQRDKPEADLIDGIPPAIAVQASRGITDRRTTVGNASEIVEYMRLLFAQLASIVCPVCSSHVGNDNAQTVAAALNELAEGTRYLVAFPADARSKDLAELLAVGRSQGFLRAIVGDRTFNTEFDLAASMSSSCSIVDQPVWFVVDRLTAGSSDLTRIRESLETAFQFGDGMCEVFISGETETNGFVNESQLIDGKPFGKSSFATKLICAVCGRLFPQAQPNLFSYNKGPAVCSGCDGLEFVDDEFESACPECHGARLGPDALAFQIRGKNIAEVCNQNILHCRKFFADIEWSVAEQTVAGRLLKQIDARLDYLSQVGLGYLTLNRPIRTLSSGEAQRVALTACLSSTLVNMLYVLDEPSIGLHPHDIGNLTQAIQKLNARGNTVVVVDHEEELIRAAPRIVEIGPAAGAAGGEIVFDGDVTELMGAEGSITGDFLAGRRGVSSGAGKRRDGRGRLRLNGACGHNLKTLDVEFPLGCLCVVSGVSGAGKSSLVRQTLYGAIGQRKEKTVPTLPFADLFGDSQIDEVVLVDQSPIGRTPRSNPVTYVKAFDDIRNTFAETADAKAYNFSASRFSFNVAGGRCDKCNGDGQLKIDMQFLADIYVKCDQCNGTRYRDETLAVRYRGCNIAEVLNLTVRQAFTFFRGQPRVQGKLKALIDVGLDYIRLGQPATTLSSGEAQRLKLAVYLNASKKKRALFILEEPTTGLHMADVTRLLDCFDALLSVGHSFIIVEHNLQIMKYADWIIDLGPGAAEHGGRVVVAGTPETVAECAESTTGRYLAEALAKCVSEE